MKLLKMNQMRVVTEMELDFENNIFSGLFRDNCATTSFYFKTSPSVKLNVTGMNFSNNKNCNMNN